MKHDRCTAVVPPASRRAFIQGIATAGVLGGFASAVAAKAEVAAAKKAQPAALPHAEIGYLSASELTAAYRSGALSPVEVLAMLYERMAALNPHCHAFVSSDTSVAMQDAKASEQRWRRNQTLGALDGVPVTVKDHMNVRGLVTTQARPPVQRLNKVATADDPVVENLKAGGAIVFGKTTSPECGLLHAGVSSLHDNVRNPWDLRRTSGGSSSGAGVAAAAGVGPIHIGSDSGGSIRGPAAYCGVFGLKTSSYSVAQPGYLNGWAVFGPLARDPFDAAQVMPLLTRANARAAEQVALPWRDDPLTRAVAELKDARIGFCPWVGDIAPQMGAEQRKAADEVVAQLGACGAKVDLVAPFVPDGFWESAIFGRVVVPRLRAFSRELPQDEFRALFSWHQAMLNGCNAVSEAAIAEADARFVAVRDKLINPLQSYDILVVQQFSGEVQSVDKPWPDYARVDERIAFSYDFVLPLWIFNYLGLPAVSVPAGFSSHGMPIGVQIVGRHGNDAGLLRVAALLAAQLNRSRPWPLRWSGIPGG